MVSIRNLQAPTSGVGPNMHEMGLGTQTLFLVQRMPECVQIQYMVKHYNFHVIFRSLPKGLDVTLEITSFTIFAICNIR